MPKPRYIGNNKVIFHGDEFCLDDFGKLSLSLSGVGGGGGDQRRYISNTRQSGSSDFQSPRRRLKKRGEASCFLTTFEVFGKHSLECSQVPLKARIILGEIQSKMSPNFMIIDQFRYI